MSDLADGEELEVKGSGSSVYRLRHVGGVYSCTCPAWMHQSIAIERRTCKHLRRLRGDEAETERIGGALPAAATGKAAAPESSGDEPPLLLAHRWENDADLTGWWMSEKLDGVRAWWNGRRLLSRLGNEFVAPAWFVAGLPAAPLDGELWGGRKRFQRTTSIVRQKVPSDAGWREIAYVVFDAPAHGGAFEARLEHCHGVVRGLGVEHLRTLEHARCEGTAHLRAELARVEALGGEGLMLRRPGSAYEAGRSSSLLKVKSFRDAEARVVEHLAGAGRHAGRLGALLVELPDGTRFSVGTGFSDREREAPPAVGSVVTFRYQELSEAGVPRFPSFVGVRDDVRLPPPAMLANVRRFEKIEADGTGKFWEIAVEGTQHRVRFGSFTAEVKVKRFADAAEAERAEAERIAEKLARGFVERE